MEVSSERTQELIQHPQENLFVEMKAWIDPDQPDGIAKIIKTALAMRNNNGGYMVIGFDDKTLEPILDNAPSNVRQMFNIDKIQGAISKYSSELFEINIDFPQRDGQEFPVIVIPTGVKTPVVAKSDLFSKDKDKQSKPLIREDTVYVRSLSSNNTPSTTQAKSKDWSSLMEICFDNREADIGRFIRRQLSGISSDQVNVLATAIAGNVKPEISNEDLLKEYLQESERCYEETLKEKKVGNIPEHGSWEVGLIVSGDIPTQHTSTQNFLNLLSSNNPDYTGWPVWLDSRSFANDDHHPRVIKGVWEALIITLIPGWSNHIDFTRLDPKGKFFLMRALEDDIGRNPPQALTVLDFSLAIIRTVEAIAVGIAFAKSMGYSSDTTTLAFAFKWTKLKKRKLSSWANNNLLDIPDRYFASDSEIVSFIDVPLETPLSALSQYVHQVTRPLFEAFNGYTVSRNTVEDITRSLIERKR
jgi:Putative DNA-binding domain